MSAINWGVKFLILPIFLGLVFFTLDYFVNILQNNINLPFLNLFSYLGVIQSIQVLISFSIASFVSNQILSFFRSA